MDKTLIMKEVETLIAGGFIVKATKTTRFNANGVRKYSEVDEVFFDSWKINLDIFRNRIKLPSDISKMFKSANECKTKYETTMQYISILRALKKLIETDNLDLNNSKNDLPLNYLPLNVHNLFCQEHYSEAVYETFKHIETIVRTKSELDDIFFGTKLMRTAFEPEKGVLSNKSLTNEEQQAQSDLFTGSIGFIKKPDEINIIEKEKAEELLYFANYLLRLIERS